MNILDFFMVGVNYDDYCSCGAVLHETITTPNGKKTVAAHSKEDHDKMLDFLKSAGWNIEGLDY